MAWPNEIVAVLMKPPQAAHPGARPAVWKRSLTQSSS